MATKSWWLGNEISFIEIDSKVNLTAEQVDKMENICNELIAASTPVSVHILSDKNEADMPAEVYALIRFHLCFIQKPGGKNIIFPKVTRATKGLPKDRVGGIRIITIQGIDSNMCCGTHVTNLAQLQCIKLLNIEKNKNRQFLNFLVGNRVLQRLRDCYNRECEFNTILKYNFNIFNSNILYHYIMFINKITISEAGLNGISDW